jgi:pyridoxamine 5'-phosphate oxidase
MADIFAGNDPFEIARNWLGEAGQTEPADPNAIALATVDNTGMPNTRMVLLKSIEDDGFVFFTNYDSKKGREIDAAGKAAFVMHWKSLARQIRVRGLVTKVAPEISDEYYKSRALGSRIGAWASAQSQVLKSRKSLVLSVAKATAMHGTNPSRPAFWGGYHIAPLEVEFWADGEFRLHDRFRWRRASIKDDWEISRLFP